MFTTISISSSDYRIKSSRFLGFLCPSQTISEADEHLNSIKKDHPAATHHCYAYVVDPNKPQEFSSDDGEPSGTAGLPILNTLKSHELMNVILVVVRYYGGTKLGKAGLIDAYQTAAEKAVENSDLKKIIPIKKYRIEYDYSQQSLINKWKNTFPLVELEFSYLETVTLILGCPAKECASFEAAITSQKHQLINFKKLDESFHIKN